MCNVKRNVESMVAHAMEIVRSPTYYAAWCELAAKFNRYVALDMELRM